MSKIILFSAILFLFSHNIFAQRELNNPLINSKDIISKGVALHDEGKYKEAIAEYLKVPMSDTNYSQVLTELALSYYSDSNYAKSEKCVAEGIELFPERKLELLRILADIYDDTKRSEAALAIYDTVLAQNKYDYITYFNKGVSLYRMEKYDEAASCFQKCIILNPYYSSSHYFLGLISLLKGNMVQAMLSFASNLLVSPANKYHKKSVSYLTSIALMNDMANGLLQNYKPGKEDNFESLQEIIVSKIALDKKYKLKADMEDEIVRQLQVMMEKLEYNPADNGFWMQFYVPIYKKLWDENKFEPLIFYMFSNLNIDKIKNYVKKEKEKVDGITSIVVDYLNLIRQTQELNYTKRGKTKINYYISNFQVTGKGEFGKNEKGESILIGPWEFYYTTGKLKSKGEFDNQGLRQGKWIYYYENGITKEISHYNLNKAEGKSESWYDNGLMYMSSNYKDDVTDGTEYLYYFNGMPKSVTNYKAGKKDGAAKNYTVNGILYSTNNYSDDMLEGEFIIYHENGKILSKSNYHNNKINSEYNEYYKTGKLMKTGNVADGKDTGPWKWFYDDGQIESTGTFKDGALDGEYLSYYKNGKLESRVFYKKGEVDGKKENYDDDGILFCETIFEKNRLRDIRFLDKKGTEISNTSSRKGNANVSFYQADGSKSSEGYFTKEGLEDGKGFTYFKNGKIYAEENYKNGKLEGKKTIYFANGKINQESAYSNDVADGYFITYFNNGAISEEGWYVAGEKQGTFFNYNQLSQLTSKEYYLNDKLDGFAEYYTANGKLNSIEHYDNGWLKKVVQYDTLGNKLSVSELAKGEGKVIFKHYNGAPYFESNYKNYKLNGLYKITNCDGALSSSCFYKNGFIDSIYKSWYTNGQMHMYAPYANAERNGEWKIYQRNGKLSEKDEYTDGKLNGKVLLYNEDGTIDKEYEYKDGNLNGTIKFYGEKNQLAAVLYYKNDVLTGYSYEDKNGNLVPVIPIIHGSGTITAYFKNGNKSVQMQINESQVDGERILYYSNGKEYVAGIRINGDENGIKKVYYPSGKIMKEENYLYGKAHGTFKYYEENGNLIYELNYYNGDLHGITKFYTDGKLTETLLYYYDMLESKK